MESKEEVKLSKQQLEDIQNFMLMAGNEDSNLAIKYLSENNWDVNKAVNLYMKGSPVQANQYIANPYDVEFEGYQPEIYEPQPNDSGENFFSSIWNFFFG